MNARVTVQALLLTALASANSGGLYAQGGAFQESKGGTAVDVKGVRHTAREYPGERAPWNFADRVIAFAPEYSVADRARHREDSGSFRIFIDANRGVATGVAILQSTGHFSLDRSAIDALRYWRWKPGTWREVDVPVTFTMASSTPPPAAIRLR